MDLQPTTSAPTEAQKQQTKKRPWFALLASALVAIALIAAGWMWAVNMSHRNAQMTPAVTVAITDNGFSPATIKIKKGQNVSWTNQSHTAQKMVAALNRPSGLATTEPLNFGDSYSFTFEEGGTYSYYDPAHIDHKGTITVE